MMFIVMNLWYVLCYLLVAVDTSDVPIPHFQLILILLLIPVFQGDTNIDTADTTNTFSSIKHQ